MIEYHTIARNVTLWMNVTKSFSFSLCFTGTAVLDRVYSWWMQCTGVVMYVVWWLQRSSWHPYRHPYMWWVTISLPPAEVNNHAINSNIHCKIAISVWFIHDIDYQFWYGW